MKADIHLLALCLSLALAAATAQPIQPPPKPPTGDEAKPPAPRETPPDQKAYNEALKLTDYVQKIAALEKVRKDFPAGVFSSAADYAILSTLLKSMPEQKDRISKSAEGIYKAAVAKDKDASKASVIVSTRSRESTALRIADVFLSANLYLKDAESYAKRSIDPMRLNIWLSEERESYVKRKQPVPSQEELVKRFETMRASRIGTLGRIELKLGHAALAEKLLKEAHAAAPDNILVAGALGELTLKAGDDAKALDYLIPVRLSGRAPESTNAAFEGAYKKAHNGSLDGLETMLDAEYHKRFPNPVHVQSYTPTEKRSDRVVLGEVFTGSGCPPCAAADLAFDAAMERFARKDFAVVMYHQHIPAPDPMTTPETIARKDYYAVKGVPTFAIDGKDTIGGGPREFARSVYDKVSPDILKELDTLAEASIHVSGRLTGNEVHVSAVVDQVKSEAQDLRVHVLLVEKELRFNGENGIRFHPMVVRAFGGEKAEGYTVNGKGRTSVDIRFYLDRVSKSIKDHLDDYEAKGHRGTSFKFKEKMYQINRDDLAIVVFVQDNKTRHILQAAWTDLGTSAAHPTTEANGSQIQ